jgi:hypothetical protein
VVTCCRVVDNMSNSSPEIFCKSLRDRNEVHLEMHKAKSLRLPSFLRPLKPFKMPAAAKWTVPSAVVEVKAAQP